MNPQFYAPLMDRLLSEGAFEVFLTPIIMKKGRPGVKLSVICSAEQIERISSEILQHTTTLGVRIYRTVRETLEREIRTIDTPYGPVNIKIAKLPCGDVKYAPEFECLNSISRRYDIPLRELYRQIMDVAQKYLTKR